MRARAIPVIVTSVFLAAGGFCPDPALAQSDSARPAVEKAVSAPIGKVVTLTGSVTIEHGNALVVQVNLGGQPPRMKIDDPVYQGDVVQTGADGKIGITFTDGTAFNLSSNARMVLNEFVYDPKGHSNSTLFSLTKGTFTFVAGQVAKTGDMKIDTPVATMGIRGTTPHVEISEDGTVKFSTLIEERKTKLEKQGAPVAPKRQARAALAQPTEAELRFDKPTRSICGGC